MDEWSKSMPGLTIVSPTRRMQILIFTKSTNVFNNTRMHRPVDIDLHYKIQRCLFKHICPLNITFKIKGNLYTLCWLVNCLYESYSQRIF